MLNVLDDYIDLMGGNFSRKLINIHLHVGVHLLLHYHILV